MAKDIDTNRHRFDFLNGNDDRLFEHYRDYQGEEIESQVSLSRLSTSCACVVRKETGSCTHNAEYVVIQPTSSRAGIVLMTNSKRIPSGATVRVKTSWKHINQTADEGAQNTIGGPGMLRIVSAPSRKRGGSPKAA